jgi:hypothetical protein
MTRILRTRARAIALPCPECHNTSATAVLSVGKFAHLRCQECGTLWSVEERRHLPLQNDTATVVYMAGDFTVTVLGPPTLYSVSSERVGQGPYLAYCDTSKTAERKGHELAKVHGVSLWRGTESDPGIRTLIASYRSPQVRRALSGPS